jgi:hypothetical protein
LGAGFPLPILRFGVVDDQFGFGSRIRLRREFGLFFWKFGLQNKPPVGFSPFSQAETKTTKTPIIIPSAARNLVFSFFIFPSYFTNIILWVFEYEGVFNR